MIVDSAKKIAVILSGCGVYDGSEIYETTLTLLSLEQAGVGYQCMAPNIEQHHVINHLTGEPMDESRNVLTEAARLARGNIINLAAAKADDYDGVILPGGFGAAKNLSNFAFAGADMEINAEVAAFVKAIHQQDKPVGLMCIAPTMVPQLFGEQSICTIGTDKEVAAAIESMGGRHEDCTVDKSVVDRKNRLVTTPAYMGSERISDVAEGIQALVRDFVNLL